MNRDDSSVVSIIVPVYNVQKYLKRCIDSLLGQSFENLQIILVNDGSEDDSGRICDDYALKDQRIMVIHKENGGLSDARNSGLKHAQGKYVMFVDSDDYIEKDMVCRLFQEMEKGADLAVCGYRKVDEEGEETEQSYIADDCVIEEEEFWQRYFYADSIYYVVSWNKMYKRELFDQIGFDKGRFHEDEFILHKIIRQCKRISCMSYIGYNYVQRGNSIMAVPNVNRTFDKIDLYMMRAAYFMKKEDTKWLYLSIVTAMCLFAEAENQMRSRQEKITFDKLYGRCSYYIKKNLMTHRHPLFFKLKAGLFVYQFPLFKILVRIKNFLMKAE